MSRSFYSILEVDSEADEVSIRRAYKRLCQRAQGDKPADDPQVVEQLRALRGAYLVLASSRRRLLYDEFGERSLEKGFDPDVERERLAKEQADAVRRARAALLYPTAIERREQPQGDGTLASTSWSLKVAVGPRIAKGGGVLRFPVTRPVRCPRCEGSGRRQKACPRCRGQRQITSRTIEPCAPCRGVGVTGAQERCPVCKGAGRYRGRKCKRCDTVGVVVKRYFCSTCGGRGLKVTPFEKACPDCVGTGLADCLRCYGRGTISKTLMFRLMVPSRVDEGSSYRYAGAGFSTVQGAPTDLYVQFTVLARAPRR